ncbi:MAG TPA: PAS domain S-box protein, partial [bacterium]|nr:PAS domain S-box protein [bacterium]
MSEKSIFESENLFKELFDNMSSGVAIYEVLNNGEDFLFKDFNKAGEKINNLKRNDIIGKKLTEIFPGVKDLGLFEVLQRVWKTGKAEIHPTSMYRDERIALWVQNYVFKLPSGNVVAMFDDITENKKIEKALETSVEEYRLLIENAQNAILYLGLDYKISSWNKTAEKIYGWEKSEAIGKTIDEIIPVEFIYETREEVEKVFFEKGVWKGEVIQYHKNGTPINILSSSIIIQDDNGNPKGMVTINHDITERIMAQQKLFDSELRFKSIFMESPNSITLYDSEGKLVDANKACLDLINIKDIEQIKGFDILDDPNMPRDIKTRILKGETVKFEVLYDFDKVEETLRAGRSGILYFDAIINPIYSEDRESVKYYLNQVSDITERRLGEKKLEESEERFRKIFEEGPLGMAIINFDDYSISKVNTMLCTMLGYTENELTDLKIQDITHPEDRDKNVELTEQIVRGDISFFTLEKRYFKKNNEILWGNLTSSIIRDKEGNALYGLGMIEDISERKNAEQKLKESEQNLKKSQKELLIRNQISKIFLTILDDKMYAEVLDIILKALKSQYGVFGYVDEDGSSVCPSMTRNIYDKCQMENKTIVF